MASCKTICLCAYIAGFLGVGCAAFLGTEFITTFMQNSLSEKCDQCFRLQVTAQDDNTTVTVAIGPHYNKNISLNSGKVIFISLTSAVEVKGSGTFQNSVVIKSDKPIHMLSINDRFRTSYTSVVYPVTMLGTDYYLMTPREKSPGNYKVFSVLAFKEATSVQIKLKNRILDQWNRPKADTTINLAPFQGYQFLSPDDLSGIQVTSEKPVAVLSGHSCHRGTSQCKHVFQQLLPVSLWGTDFFVAPFPLYNARDFACVVAANTTQVTYTYGLASTEKQVSLVPSQILQISFSVLPIRITANAGVQVTFFSDGVRVRQHEYGPLFMNILDTAKYCTSYIVYGQNDINNYAIVIAVSDSVNEITFDGKPLENPEWKVIGGTNYSWLLRSLGKRYTYHTFKHPRAPFGVQSMGTSATASYGSPAICLEDSGTPPPSCDTLTCPQRQDCVMENHLPKCVPKFSECSAIGDPHYTTFDGRYYDFMGTCTYTMVSICEEIDSDLPRFIVLAKNDNRGNLRVSWVAHVTFQTGIYTIDIKKNEVGYVRVNNVRSLLPVSLMNGTLRMFHSGNALALHFGNDVQVSYDWNHVLRIKLTRRYANSVCGLCGNYNQNPEDDFQMPSGYKVLDATALGKSWKVGNDPTCWDDCHGPCLNCPPNAAQLYRTESYCGLINKVEGPFSACYEIIDPKMYMENCAYDVCFNDGNKKVFCDSLKTYADSCQRAGVNIREWREEIGCSFECPANSLYKLCGRACSASCQDPDASSQCSEQCIETCECNPGLVLIKGQCQPRESCGCFYKELLYASKETFWGDDICQQRCICNGQTHEVECKHSPCGAQEECTKKDGLIGCYPTNHGFCVVSGDTNYITFDGQQYIFSGTCQYQLSTLCDHNNELDDFQVNIWKQNQCSLILVVKAYGKEIQMNAQNPNKVKVDGVFYNLPYASAEGHFSLFHNPNSVVVSTEFGLVVTFDLSSIVTVSIPGIYSGKVCGLCGNFNGNNNDDLIARGQAISTSVAEFVQSWNVTECEENIPDLVCDDLEEQKWKQRNGATDCGIMLYHQGPFGDCHKLVDPEAYFKSCTYDYCLHKNDQTMLCTHLSSYALACQVAGASIYPWRSEDFCSYSCPANSHYELCANGCPFTCNGFTSPAGCDSSCREGCVCDDGFVLSGATCVRLSSCGCTDNNGVYYSVGESYYVGDACDKQCTCNEGGLLSCSPSSCSANEECRIENGEHRCLPVGQATCTVSGYCHFRTYDRRTYNHQGLCSYILSQSCADRARSLTEFRVMIQHKTFGSSTESVKLVTVEMYGESLTLKQAGRGIVTVNGADFRLPVTLLSGKIRVEPFGLGTLIESKFGLKVTYDLSFHVTISVPDAYRDNTCGMCGNFNGNPDDDFGQTPTEIMAFTENDLISDSGDTFEAGCGNRNNPCKFCPRKKRETYSQEKYCGIISDRAGPFAKCHSSVNPASFQNDCVFDQCQTNGSSTMLCDSIAAYAAACEKAGVTDIQWRYESFCGVQCPPHSHYTTCAKLCTSSCAALTDPHGCRDECAEGCECDGGYMFDGTQCIPLQQCGCFGNGRYYKLKETLLNEDCSQECTCNPNAKLSCRPNHCAKDKKCQIKNRVTSCVKPAMCGENSHYENCGSACPATCSDRNAPSRCTKPCVETCQCDENFVLNDDKCVPISSCRCQHNGQYYLPNQEFWSDKKCKERCKCNPSLGKVVCQKASCKSSEKCSVVKGKLGCYPNKYSTCIATGDPHYTTFDGKRFDFMGTCIYKLVGVTSNYITLKPFTVHVQNDNRGNRAVSYTKDVTLNVYGQTITMSKDFPQKIKVNGILTELPYYYETSKITAYITGVHVFIKTDFDVTVTFDGYSYARVILPSKYRGAVNGLCGNNNKDPSDDFIMGDGTKAQSEVEFGDHWKVGEVQGCTKECVDCPTCSQDQKNQYKSEEFCGLLSKPDGPFSLCHSFVDPTPYFEDCVFDACQYFGHQSTVCNSIAAYVSSCQTEGVEMTGWRKPTFCPLSCPENSHYELCGSGCPTTCYNVSAPQTCLEPCTEGCFCDKGFLLSGKNCVPIGQCGCVHKHKYYKEGEEFYTDDQCQQKCKCTNNGEITCRYSSCGADHECKVVQGVLGCYAKEFRYCTACGDPHYTTFDGLIYDFHGTCKYTLVKVDSDTAKFSVEVEQEPNGNKNVAVAKSLTVQIDDNIFNMDRDSSWSILVNNERYNLPYKTTDGQVWVNQEGNNVILQSNIGLKVLFGQMYFVSVWVASSFSGMTQGLCANSNKDKTDDFKLPDGSITTDPATFGAFWAVSSDGTDCKGCTVGTCLVCDPRQEAEAKSPKSCGMIAAPQGPFRDCHALVAPEVYVTNCVYDMCAGKMEQESLCMSLQAYAVMCQNAGANIENWRTVSNCPLDCPPKSHYEPCTRTCDISCAGMFMTSTCTDSCFEGCECDSGYLLDGGKCVRPDLCGCNYDGRYLKVNESVVSEGCNQRCTCQSGSVFCEAYGCKANENCQLEDGQRGCYPKNDLCFISTDNHFTRFDGVSEVFPSRGTYVMASSYNTRSDSPFLVAVHVGQFCEEGRQRSLHIFTSQGLITVNEEQEIWFNGQEINMSSDLGNHFIKVKKTTSEVVIEIVDQITVVKTVQGDVKLIANEKISSHTCGKCGNFTREACNNALLKNGNPASSVTHSWAARLSQQLSEVKN